MYPSSRLQRPSQRPLKASFHPLQKIWPPRFRAFGRSTASGAGASIAGLPFAIPNQTYALIPAPVQFGGGAAPQYIVPVINTSTANFLGASGAGLTNANVSTLSPNFCLVYSVS
jgi:hypothetical protein